MVPGQLPASTDMAPRPCPVGEPHRAVVNPVTVRPIAAGEESIRDIYRTSLTGLYHKPAG